MADQKTSVLDTIPAVDRSADLLYIVDDSGNSSNKVTPNTLLGISGDPVGTSDSQTLTNKTITSPTIASPTLSGTVTGTYTIGGTPTFPSTIVTTTGTQTLTNKTLTSPTINTATIANPTLTVDTVSEFTSANGVNIDGVVLKDSNATVNDLTASGTAFVTGVISAGSHIDVTDGSAIRDGNNNELVVFQETASAVNQIDVTNAATGNAPSISATGDDTNIDLELVAKGTGKVKFIVPFAHATDATQTITTASETTISFDTEVTDTDTMFDSGTPTRITFTKAGIYTITAGTTWTANATGRRGIFIRLDGTTTLAGQESLPGGTYGYSQSVSITRAFNAAQYIEFRVIHTKGSDLAATNSFMSAVRVGKAA